MSFENRYSLIKFLSFLGVTFLFFVVLASLLLNNVDYFQTFTKGGELESPSLAHPLGTDSFKRDFLFLIISATSYTIWIAFLTAFGAAIVGASLIYVGQFVPTALKAPLKLIPFVAFLLPLSFFKFSWKARLIVCCLLLVGVVPFSVIFVYSYFFTAVLIDPIAVFMVFYTAFIFAIGIAYITNNPTLINDSRSLGEGREFFVRKMAVLFFFVFAASVCIYTNVNAHAAGMFFLGEWGLGSFHTRSATGVMPTIFSSAVFVIVIATAFGLIYLLENRNDVVETA